ncbi:MATE family Na+-driven efflux transporter [Endozoicomonas numazuensis]|uniref:Multidrug transporter n=1 Tax=Endozoicomonas numazuensis TaxID=1137799 RepID=A0A081N9H7_9GAMM|nr:MATE family Na+-driven efflux transporter [Endozoicomonas numazuensis]KEQ15100.1 multidrug transporter [Endozoicomonas numazuensis]
MIALRKLDYRLFLALLLTQFIPVIYSTMRVYFLGSLPETWGFNIASQVAWLNLLYEVLTEGLLLPLYFILGQVTGDSNRFRQRVSVALGVFIGAYGLLSAFVLTFSDELVVAMEQSEALKIATVSYIRLESVGLLLSSVYAMTVVILVILKHERLLYHLLLFKALLTVVFDSLFVSQFSFSMQLGVNGVAWTNILVNGFMVAGSLYWLHRLNVLGFTKQGVMEGGWLKQWSMVSARSGLESLVRNLAFMWMILKMVNEVEQSGTYWVTNQFIWGWLLLPVLALGNLIKQDVATHEGNIGTRMTGYMQLTGLFILLWVLSMPGWQWFIHTIMGIAEFQKITELAMLLVIFYAVFSLNNVLDSYFYGSGRTDLMLYQSLIVNTVFYGGAYLLYLQSIFVPGLTSIAVLFGLGITFDALVTLGMYVRVKRQPG